MPQFVVTAVGPDRPGIVGELTSHIHAGGGNILDSRMVNLRGEFAMLILLEGAPALTAQLPPLGEKIGLRLTISHVHGAKPVRGTAYRLKTYALDQPGIVARLTQVLREFAVNIEELTARQESAPFDGSPLFVTEMRLTIPENVPIPKLRSELQSVAATLNCDLDLDPA